MLSNSVLLPVPDCVLVCFLQLCPLCLALPVTARSTFSSSVTTMGCFLKIIFANHYALGCWFLSWLLITTHWAVVLYHDYSSLHIGLLFFIMITNHYTLGCCSLSWLLIIHSGLLFFIMITSHYTLGCCSLSWLLITTHWAVVLYHDY